MKKLILLAATIAISSSAFADEMTSILVQGTKTICSNDNLPVAMNSNLQVSVPESALQGTGLSTKRYALKKDVKVKIGTRNCTLPKWDETKRTGTVLEKVVIKIFCTQGSTIRVGLSNGTIFDEDLYADGARSLCGGADSMFKRISSSDLDLESNKYVVDGDDKNLYLTDSSAIFTGTIEPQTKVTYLISSDATKYAVPYITGAHDPSDGTAQN